jgi:hypothetical protein
MTARHEGSLFGSRGGDRHRLQRLGVRSRGRHAPFVGSHSLGTASAAIRRSPSRGAHAEPFAE